MNISLPDALRAFVDEQVASGDFGTSSEYIRHLLRRERDLARAQASDGPASGPASSPPQARPGSGP